MHFVQLSLHYTIGTLLLSKGNPLSLIHYIDGYAEIEAKRGGKLAWNGGRLAWFGMEVGWPDLEWR
jgi:hypothetical protein